MGHVTISQPGEPDRTLGSEDDFSAAFYRWMAARRAEGSVCSQPGTPGSSPACASCTASCSSEPADVDPAEVDALALANAAVLTRWDADRTEGRRA